MTKKQATEIMRQMDAAGYLGTCLAHITYKGGRKSWEVIGTDPMTKKTIRVTSPFGVAEVKAQEAQHVDA